MGSFNQVFIVGTDPIGGSSVIFSKSFHGTIGGLWLARSGVGDVFYATDVYAVGYQPARRVWQPPSPDRVLVPWVAHSEPQDWFPSELDEQNPVIEGYYQDDSVVAASQFEPYTVTLYIELETE